MNQLMKVEVNIDLTNPAHVEALHLFTQRLGGKFVPDTTVTVADGKPLEKDKASKVEKSKTTVHTVSPETIAEVKAVSEANAEQSSDDGAELSLDDIREIMAPVLKANGGAHRETVKAKLTELGVNNLTALDPKHYTTFVGFLNAL